MYFCVRVRVCFFLCLKVPGQLAGDDSVQAPGQGRVGGGALRALREAAAVLPERVLQDGPQHVQHRRRGPHEGPLQGTGWCVCVYLLCVLTCTQVWNCNYAYTK